MSLHLTQLPNGILSNILNHLSFQDILSISKTCRLFRTAVFADTELWSNMLPPSRSDLVHSSTANDSFQRLKRVATHGEYDPSHHVWLVFSTSYSTWAYLALGYNCDIIWGNDTTYWLRDNQSYHAILRYVWWFDIFKRWTIPNPGLYRVFLIFKIDSQPYLPDFSNVAIRVVVSSDEHDDDPDDFQVGMLTGDQTTQLSHNRFSAYRIFISHPFELTQSNMSVMMQAYDHNCMIQKSRASFLCLAIVSANSSETCRTNLEDLCCSLYDNAHKNQRQYSA